MYPRISLATRGPPRPAPASGGARRTLRRRRQVLEFPEQLWTSADAGSDGRRRSESHLKLLFLLIKQERAERVGLRLAFLGRRPSGAGAMRRSTALQRGCRTRSIRGTWVRIPISSSKASPGSPANGNPGHIWRRGWDYSAHPGPRPFGAAVSPRSTALLRGCRTRLSDARGFESSAHSTKKAPRSPRNGDLGAFLAERVGFEPTCRFYPTIRFRVGAVMTASVPLPGELVL